MTAVLFTSARHLDRSGEIFNLSMLATILLLIDAFALERDCIVVPPRNGGNGETAAK
jgi:hypothetical protein